MVEMTREGFLVAHIAVERFRTWVLFFLTDTLGGRSMKVAIIMGSNSDWPILEPAEKTLKEFGVEVEVIVASAHRTPDVVHEFAAGARNRGVEAIIAAAGAAAHLGGVIAAYTTVPVIGIPINATPLNGMDALLSFVQMPAGIPVATMAINGAKKCCFVCSTDTVCKIP